VNILLAKYFKSLVYFYSYLEYRIFVVICLSILIGILDGLGLSMFLPLLQLVNDPDTINSEALGKLTFLVGFIEYTGLSFNLLSVLGLMGLFFFAKGIIQYIVGVYKVNIQQWFIRRLRVSNIKGLNSLAFKYFVTADNGRIQNTLTGEVDKIAYAFENYFTAIQYGILVFVYMAFAFTIDAQFAILVTLGGVLTNFIYKNLYKNTMKFSKSLTVENNAFQGLVIQNIFNYKYLKATGSIREYGQTLEKSAIKIEENNKVIGKLDALMNAGREPILMIIVVTVIYIQTTFFNSNLGPILISLIFFYRALGYLMQLQLRWNRFLGVSGSMENMTSFQQELKDNSEENGSILIHGQIDAINLKSVYFYYNQTLILENVSINIIKNETIAFVGESGSGKTTLVNIISGLLPVQIGNYEVNGIDISNIDKNSFQKKIGYITQDPVIFNDTIYNNVCFLDKHNEDNMKKFWDAVEQASLLPFIEALPEKENTLLGGNGINLSGGQRQRISIARELYKNINILILDEATSSLDSATEVEIQQNIDNLKGRYTILMVAHRISTIKNADRIVVMKNGRIKGVNNFQKLLKESEYFKMLVDLQEI